jgi:hypothetical protein
MRITGRSSVAAKTAKAAKAEIKALLKAINAATICENNWGHAEPKRRKWIYLDPRLSNKRTEIVSPRLHPWARN